MSASSCDASQKKYSCCQGQRSDKALVKKGAVRHSSKESIVEHSLL